MNLNDVAREAGAGRSMSVRAAVGGGICSEISSRPSFLIQQVPLERRVGRSTSMLSQGRWCSTRARVFINPQGMSRAGDCAKSR